MNIPRLRQVALDIRRKLLESGPEGAVNERFIEYCRHCFRDGGGEIGICPGELEALGWLYQFFVAGDKIRMVGKKVAVEDMPAATQLFTPRWIVEYLVENSLGRLWMLNHPDSSLAGSMAYYIDAEPPPGFPRLNSPEEIRVCDPCCGSGNMLLYAYELLERIYRECGYSAEVIPGLIIGRNLCGMDIDPRAVELAAFILEMKAGEGGGPPRITVSDTCCGTGSLMDTGERYEVVVTNPPFMGRRKMDPALKKHILECYPDSHADLFAVFIERCLEMLVPGGIAGMVTMQNWMFLKSFAGLRDKLLGEDTILSMLHLGPRGFDSIIGEVVQTTAFCMTNRPLPQYRGRYFRLTAGADEAAKQQMFSDILRAGDEYRKCAGDFRRIPGHPIAYWADDSVAEGFRRGISLKAFGDTRQGMATSDNERFLRRWYEVPRDEIGFDAASHAAAAASGRTWFPYNKGGDCRKWYGNAEFVVNWKDDGKELKDFAAALYRTPTRTLKSISEYFKPAVSWSKISGTGLNTRYYPPGFIFDVAGCSIFAKNDADLKFLLGLTNSKPARKLLEAISPTLNFEAGHLAVLPVIREHEAEVVALVDTLIGLAREDWDSFETSWNFRAHPLMEWREQGLREGWGNLRHVWQERTDRVQALENELNRIFCFLYHMAYEPVPLHEITLNCNPLHRYRRNTPEAELEKRLRLDTMKAFISYGVGCIFGRYRSGVVKRAVVPITGKEYFANDLAGCFHQFLSETFGGSGGARAAAFLEEVLGKDLRRYFLRDFYRDHVQMYHRRPIYWLFRSPHGRFNALVYLHDYQPDTVSSVLAYLRRMAAVISLPPVVKADLADYEKTLTALAEQKIEINPNDGVPANYRKFGNALKRI
mgnify:CR=1 FL=1